MNLDLLERIFQDLETIYYLEEAKNIAKLFLKIVRDNHFSLQEDYWIQIGKDWDLNIVNGKELTLYPCRKAGGYFETDTSDGKPVFD